jgi:PIN domain nuclease of toxin-antitoxin system
VILLDTHVALWTTFNPERLGKRCRKMIDQAVDEGQLAVSAVSFWEIALLTAKRRLRSKDSAVEMRRAILAEGVNELPLTGDIAILATELDGLHGDPADRFIAATAITNQAMLITADENLLKWRHGLRRHNAQT